LQKIFKRRIDMPKYEVNNNSVETLLNWIKSSEIAIPEIQRPFVWDYSKVRDLIDSLYQGFPVGYIINWKSSDIKLKDGSKSEGKKILIDGQQRITALSTALLGFEIVRKDYSKKRIVISFNPNEERFEVHNPAIGKNKEWISDISSIYTEEKSLMKLVREYCDNNNIVDLDEMDKLSDKFERLHSIKHRLIGIIELAHDLPIETVTEIFIRINSKGVELSQADFAMSKIAVNENYNGNIIRKTIDYFCHVLKNPTDFENIKKNDIDFSDKENINKIKWVSKYNEEIYIPEYKDLIRVVFTKNFNRGRLTDLVSLLSGRDFETRENKEEIIESSFKEFEKGVYDFINETNFKKYIMILKSAGIITSKLVRSQNVLNFGYILYLKLKEINIHSAEIETYVRKWVVFSILTGRYSGSPESAFDFDIKRISSNYREFIENEINNGLSPTFWEAVLPTRLDTSVSSSPYFNVYVMAQVKLNDNGFLSRDIKVKELIEEKGDIHHIFPKDYLKKSGISNRGKYNQVANYVYMQSEINIRVKNKAPNVYFQELLKQCGTGELNYGGILEEEMLRQNLESNCIPESIFEMTFGDYEDFLKTRRELMAVKIKDYFYRL
jgi:hypothetical protein